MGARELQRLAGAGTLIAQKLASRFAIVGNSLARWESKNSIRIWRDVRKDIICPKLARLFGCRGTLQGLQAIGELSRLACD